MTLEAELYNLYGDCRAVYSRCPFQANNYAVCGLYALACLKLAILNPYDCVALLGTIDFDIPAIYGWIGALRIGDTWNLPVSPAFVAPTSLPPYPGRIAPIELQLVHDSDDELQQKRKRRKHGTRQNLTDTHRNPLI